MSKTLNKTILFSLTALLFLSAKCGSGKYEYPAETSVEMIKTGCFGSCPSYNFKLKGDGTATINGRTFVDYEGEHYRTYGADTTNMIFEQLIAADMEQYKKVYDDKNVTDLPTTYITFKHEGQQKKIKMRIGFPKELGAMVDQLNEIALTKGWMEGTAPPPEEKK